MRQRRPRLTIEQKEAAIDAFLKQPSVYPKMETVSAPPYDSKSLREASKRTAKRSAEKFIRVGKRLMQT